MQAGQWSLQTGSKGSKRNKDDEDDAEVIQYLGEEDGADQVVKYGAEDANDLDADGEKAESDDVVTPERSGREERGRRAPKKEKEHPYPNVHNIPLLVLFPSFVYQVWLAFPCCDVNIDERFCLCALLDTDAMALVVRQCELCVTTILHAKHSPLKGEAFWLPCF